MSSISNIQVIRVGLLKELLSLSGSSTKCSSFPAVKSARGLYLINLSALSLIDTSNNHANTKGTDTSWLCVFLE